MYRIEFICASFVCFSGLWCFWPWIHKVGTALVEVVCLRWKVVWFSVFACGASLQSRRDKLPWSFWFVLGECICWHTHSEWCRGSSAGLSSDTLWCASRWSCCCNSCAWYSSLSDGWDPWGFFERCGHNFRSENPQVDFEPVFFQDLIAS